MQRHVSSRRLRRFAVVPLAVAALLFTGLAPGGATPRTTANPLRGVARLEAAQHRAAARSVRPQARSKSEGGGGETDGDSLEVADQADQYAFARSAPAQSVSAAALIAARRQAAALPIASGRTSEITNQPMNAEPSGYDDPYWSNAGAGFGLVSGRTTALAVDGRCRYRTPRMHSGGVAHTDTAGG